MLVPEKKKCDFGAGSAASAFTGAPTSKLSPKSSTRVQELSQEPTRATISEHEKWLTSAEGSVQKALALLNRTSSELILEAEKTAARAARLDSLKKRKLDQLEDAKKKARADGLHEADVECNPDGDDGAGEEGGDVGSGGNEASEAESGSPVSPSSPSPSSPPSPASDDNAEKEKGEYEKTKTKASGLDCVRLALFLFHCLLLIVCWIC